MERHPAFAIPLPARHLGTAEASAEGDPDALGTGAHGPEDRLLHRPPIADTALDLAGDVLGHQLSVQLRLLDLLDRDPDSVAEALLEVLAELVD